MIRYRSQSPPCSPHKRQRTSYSLPPSTKSDLKINNDGSGITSAEVHDEDNEHNSSGTDIFSSAETVALSTPADQVPDSAVQDAGEADDDDDVVAIPKVDKVKSQPYTLCDWRDLRGRHFNSIIKRLELELKDPTSSLELRLNILGVIKDKLENKEASRKAPRQKDGMRPKTAQEVMTFLRPTPVPSTKPNELINQISIEQPAERDQSSSSSTEKCEEESHPWAVGIQTPIPKYVQGDGDDSHFTRSPEGLLLRIYDSRSKGVIKSPVGGLVSQASYRQLHTTKEREIALQEHANWGSRKASPFISTTTSPDEIAMLRIPHMMDRSSAGEPFDGKLVVINTHARIAARMPFIRMKQELAHYNVHTPYGNQKNFKNSYFENEYLLLFRANAEEIVQVWDFCEMVEWAQKHGIPAREGLSHYGIEHWFRKWFKAVAVPAFHQHEEQRQKTLLLAKAKTSTAVPSPAFVSTRSVSTGSVSTGSVPTGSVPTGSVPTGSVPTGYVPTGSVSAGSVSAGSVSAGSVSAGSVLGGSKARKIMEPIWQRFLSKPLSN